ncbi:DUF3006 domain-containing protein [Bacillus nitroreducens]
MQNKYTVDRFEGHLAVLLLRDNERIQININRDELPSDLQEGDIIHLDLNEDGSIKYVEILHEETAQARKTAEDLLEKLKNKK